MTALVSFDRVFEVLDLRTDDRGEARRRARSRPARPADPSSTTSTSRYPSAEEVSLASLESVAVLDAAARPVRSCSTSTSPPSPANSSRWSARPVPARRRSATWSARIYDPRAARSDQRRRPAGRHHARCPTRRHGHPGRAPVPRHDPGQPDATPSRTRPTNDRRRAARRADHSLVESLPQGLDTVVGDRGYRLSGGEKQRLAIARLMLKAPRSSCSTRRPRTWTPNPRRRAAGVGDGVARPDVSLVIAHRLSTVRTADADPGDQQRPDRGARHARRTAGRRTACTRSCTAPSSPARRADQARCCCSRGDLSRSTA